MRKFKMIEHQVDVNVYGINCRVCVIAPDNMSNWKLTRLAAQKLGLMSRPHRKGHSHFKSKK